MKNSFLFFHIARDVGRGRGRRTTMRRQPSGKVCVQEKVTLLFLLTLLQTRLFKSSSRSSSFPCSSHTRKILQSPEKKDFQIVYKGVVGTNGLFPWIDPASYNLFLSSSETTEEYFLYTFPVLMHIYLDLGPLVRTC